MNQGLKDKFANPKFVLIFLGSLAGITLLVWFIKRIQKPAGPAGPDLDKKTTLFSHVFGDTTVDATNTAGTQIEITGGGHAARAHGVQDAGRDTVKYVYLNANNSRRDGADGTMKLQTINVSQNLPAAVTPPGAAPSPESAGAWIPAEHKIFNSDDVNIDSRILQHWAMHESRFQDNTTPERNGQFWAKNWEAWGPLDPFTPRHQNAAGDMEITPGPTDPQLAYANALVASMDAQAKKFAVTENPNDVTFQYRNQLQQIPGSHFETFSASWNAHDTPMVVDRRAHLPQMAARWVVMQMNEKLRKEHPCFSLSGREHFELSNPPQNCGDTANQKENPITLIRVFESRLMKVDDSAGGDGKQLLFLTMEIGNHISGGAGGMFHTVVTIDNRGNFVHYTIPDRDQKQTFVLPRTRTDAS